ncbi:GNAT family N-acetyltransferase [Pontibacter sp. 13R65]|uniref:GNAT family N-acetyltransferase n=1 Tax=Pontibacter sp. 13R65 TaxID=3127458 RepID=UPI00301D3D86
MPASDLRFVLVRESSSRFLPAIQTLYEAAFPVEERRRFEQLINLLQEPLMHLQAVVQQNVLAGFLIYWELDNNLFLEHLAVKPQLRGQGVGQHILQWLLQLAYDKQVLLEVEKPTTNLAQKRIQFYQRAGFTLHAHFNYQQPPYERNGQPVPLLLMSKQAINTTELSQMAALIREKVYEAFYS